MKSEILVIVVTFNGMKWIDKCVSSVLSSDLPADLLVIDNGSTDGTVEWLQRHNIEVLAQRNNLGFGAANNLGMRRALEEGYSYVYLLNQDAWVEPGTFRLLTEAMEDGRYGILSPVQLDGSGKKMDRQFAKRCKSYLRKQKDEKIVEVPFVMASHWMISRGCLQKVGGFSPAFIMYGEDDNYIDRARWNGYLCGVVPAASAVHDRADRPSNKDQRMFLKCNASIVHVSNPAGWELLRLIGEPLRLTAIGCLHFDGTPFKFIGKLIKRYPELLKLRRKSRKPGAFLIPEKKKK